MKYLVNRETKEHKILHADTIYSMNDWAVVDADDEGWIKWDGKEWDCPLPDNARCDLKWRNNPDDIDINKKAGAGWAWKQSIVGGNFVEAYRPILPAESRPPLEETWHAIKQNSKVDVFTRLSAAVSASESIPALIAEINAMLHPRFEVREKAKTEQPAEDMSDWRNWREGDLLQCVNSEGWEAFENGKLYTITREAMGGVYISFVYISSSFIEDFKFHSRRVTK